MKYIDADKLIAEIERLNKENNELRKNGGSIGQEFLFGIGAGYADVLKIIESLQQEQPEVDLEKSLDEYYKNADFGPSEAIEYEIHKDIARHFYELGLNARK